METIKKLKEQQEEARFNKPQGAWAGTSLSAKEGQEWDKKKEMDFTYTNLDQFIRLSLGENAHFSNALYNGDYTLSLEEAQLRKYRFVAEQLGIRKGSKVLDLGCGWGGWLKFLKEEAGAHGIGVNLSEGQAAACRSARAGWRMVIQPRLKMAGMVIATMRPGLTIAIWMIQVLWIWQMVAGSRLSMCRACSEYRPTAGIAMILIYVFLGISGGTDKECSANSGRSETI